MRGKRGTKEEKNQDRQEAIACSLLTQESARGKGPR